MKFILFLSLILSSSAFASKPVIALNDLTFATGTGIEDIQFLFGGDDENISGIVDKEAVRKQFHSNMLGVYRCYSSNLSEQKKSGKILVKLELQSAPSPTSTAQRRPLQVKVVSSDFGSVDFANCVAAYWSKIAMPTSHEGTTSEVVMPIEARLRATDTLEH